MAKREKISPAKQRIIDNYEMQRQMLIKEGYEERLEIISILKANLMVFVTALPLVIAGIVFWGVTKKHGAFSFSIFDGIWFLLLYFGTMFLHEVLHGLGWSIWTKEGWKSIFLGVMWESLTPYCHCKEPLTPGKYMFGGLLPFVVLGIGLYVLAFSTDSLLLLWLSLFNILGAGGDLAIMLHVFKYRKAYLLDHPTECGFAAFECF